MWSPNTGHNFNVIVCNTEPEAVDLLLETEKLEWLVQHIDAKNFARTCLYLTSCCAYLPEDDDSKVMQTAYQIYTKEKQYPDAMKVALMMNDQVGFLACSALLCLILQHAEYDLHRYACEQLLQTALERCSS